MLMLVLDSVLSFLPFYLLYISLLFFIFEKRSKNLKIPVSLISFVDNELFISQNKSLVVSDSQLFCSYHIMSFFFRQFGLIIKYGKMKVFYFSRSHRLFNFLSLDFTTLEGPILYPKETQCYLRFIFDRKLTFWQYINFYMNKTLSTIKCMKMLGNSSRGLILTQKQLLYRSCCYDLKLKVLSNRTTLVLSNTRELNRVPNTKQSTLYTITHGPC